MRPLVPILCAALGVLLSGTASSESLHYRINGVDVLVEHALGAEAERLIARQLATKPQGADGNAAQWAVRGQWRELASIEGPRSHVLQVGERDGAVEAISSTLDLSKAIARVPDTPLWLPPGTLVTSLVETLDKQSSQQWSARSTWHAVALHRWLRLSAQLQGWRVEQQSAGSLQLQRGDMRLQVAVLPPRPPAATGSVALLTRWRR
jgi:hypothetical protein